MSALATVILPSSWTFDVGSLLVPLDQTVSASLTVIDRASDVSGVPSYRVLGTVEGLPTTGWLEKAVVERSYKRVGSATVTNDGDPDLTP